MANKTVKNLLTEQEWRAAGFRAQPTRYQMTNPAVGCCVACGVKLVHKKLKTRQWMFVIGAAILAVLALVILTFTFVPR